ncbi:Imm52 family immunity protein [Stutzerimonas nitrititolerans]|uniref:Imm52 family immunity protein n=2 Tax=Stutzerimonas nitrititolerans TaxID=2482751 RepID=UPI00289E1C19|nr:Imm52 family immunity protein [Stutzerimonas nitrititolerans]
MTLRLKPFAFEMRFDKAAISSVPPREQAERALSYLAALGELHPILANWYLKGDSLEQALEKNALTNPGYLINEAGLNRDHTPGAVKFAVWNGIEDPLQGGLTFRYNAHAKRSMSTMSFNDGGALLSALTEPRALLLEMMRRAVVTWPEIDWAVIAPEEYYLDGKVFPDRQTIGWIGFCPHALRRGDYPDATELMEVPGRGTLVVSCAEVMDPSNREHFKTVGAIDTKLVELGYLPLFNN